MAAYTRGRLQRSPGSPNDFTILRPTRLTRSGLAWPRWYGPVPAGSKPRAGTRCVVTLPTISTECTIAAMAGPAVDGQIMVQAITHRQPPYPPSLGGRGAGGLRLGEGPGS